MKKITAFIVTLMLTVSMMVAFVSADDASIKVKFRIEGVSGNIYYDTFETTSTTLTDVLKELDAASDDITMTITESQYGNYLSSLNGIDEGSHGDMSGWMLMVNKADPDVGMDGIRTETALYCISQILTVQVSRNLRQMFQRLRTA